MIVRAPHLRAEVAQILGRHHDALRSRTHAHNARAEADLLDLGTTRNGTSIILNRQLFASDRIIATGSVEPHYFAGCTGGRKAFLPGVASFRTIEANHGLELSLISGAYRLGYQKAAKMAAVSHRARVAAKTELDASTLRSMFFEPVNDLQLAVSHEVDRVAVESRHPATERVLSDGGVTVPEVLS